MTQQFWLDDYTILYKNGNYLNFFPKGSMFDMEMINSLSRFLIYLTILFVIFKTSWKYVAVPITFMNILMNDYVENPQRKRACEHSKKCTKKLTNKYFYDNLFVDVDDIYENRQSQRAFYTMPNTTIPNDQTKFANALYKMPETCKTDQENCLRYEDPRYKRFTKNVNEI